MISQIKFFGFTFIKKILQSTQTTALSFYDASEMT